MMSTGIAWATAKAITTAFCRDSTALRWAYAILPVCAAV